MGSQAAQAYQNFLQPQNPEDYQELFQQAYVDPARMQYERSILPAIKEQFMGDGGSKASGALNQALAQSATDLGTALGSEFGNFYQQQQANQLSALSGLSGLAGQQTFQPVIQPRPGIGGSLLSGAGSILGGALAGPAGYALSSRKFKKNIREYTPGMEKLRFLEVKQYDYANSTAPIDQNRVGLLAESVPKEFTAETEKGLAVDVYGLVGLLINSVQELEMRIRELEQPAQEAV